MDEHTQSGDHVKKSTGSFRETAHAILGVVFICAPAILHAEDDQRWLQKSQEIVKNSEKTEVPDWLRTNSQHEWLDVAAEIRDQSREKAMGPDHANKILTHQDLPKDEGYGAVLLASLSMPKTELRELLSVASETNSIVVFRGVKKGGRIDSISLSLRDLVNNIENPPTVTINPLLFRKWNITAVPTTVVVKGETAIAQARGMYGVDWLLRQVKNQEDEFKDYGSHGTVYEIEEEDLIDEMQRRMAEIDWKEKREKAVDRFWSKYSFIDLPQAVENREFTVDPSITVDRDITDGNGNVIVASGTVVNPLDQMPFSKTLLIFDSESEAQIDFAENYLSSREGTRFSVMLITTKINRNDGWKKYAELEKRFNQPVYLLNNAIQDRFSLKRVPSAVSADGKVFVVNEYRVSAP